MADTPRTQHCMVCESPLFYRDAPLPSDCHYCGSRSEALIVCPQGHFVCDSCHGAGAVELLPKLADRVAGRAPEDILEELLLLPGLPMHGPEHHPLAALALLLAAGKTGVELPAGAVPEAIRRGLQIPGGACGYLGACGAGISLGIAVSLASGATPLRGRERGLANRASAAGLDCAGDGHPRCCKRALRRAVRVGRRFFSGELGIALPPPDPPPRCRDHGRNGECPGPGCPFFPG